MAFLQVNFFSDCLKRTVDMNVILPTDKITASKSTIKEYKTLYLLHGLFGSRVDWINNTRIQKWAEDYNLVVVMPSGDNSFYIDYDIPSHEYGRFVGEELVKITRDMFPLSHRREDTFIGGLSMGGFGALRNGLKYSSHFGYIIALSSAIHFFYQEQREKQGGVIEEDKIFGDMNIAKDSDKNPSYLVKHFEGEKPYIFMACGKQDGLLEANRLFKQDLEENHFDLTYYEDQGKHDWIFWDQYIEEALKWLPLASKEKGLSSGHISIGD